jgi:4-aminobutyrate aminotransferase-like enzyme
VTTVSAFRSWCRVDPDGIPHLVTPEIPGPRSRELNERGCRYIRGLSSQVRLFPVVFKRGEGVVLEDVDGNRYLDFSSGIYVAGLGHCHPKVSEAVAHAAKTLMNCHDFNTPVKVELLEKIADIMPGDLRAVQLYDSGTVAVEAGIRVMRAATGKDEFISCYRDFHGKTLASVSCARMNPIYAPTRAPGFYLLPRPYPYRCLFGEGHTLENCCSDKYLEMYDEFLKEGTAGNVAGFVLEPIQGWAGSVFPPEDFFGKLRKFCDERGLLLMADEVLTGMGRTGKWLAMEHYGALPDVVSLGKGFGNGFPVTAIVAREKYGEAIDRISASTSYGGNPMACAAALASIQVIEEEGILQHALELGTFFSRRMEKMKEQHPIIGDVRGKGCLMGIELVKDRATKEPFDEAGKLVYQKAFRMGLAWIPAGHILRMSPPMVMDLDLAAKGMDIIDEAIGETEKELGY